MIVSILVLFFSYPTRLVKLLKKATSRTKKRLRIIPRRIWIIWMANCDYSDSSGPSEVHLTLRFLFLETVYVCLHAYHEVYKPVLWDVSLLWFNILNISLTNGYQGSVACARSWVGHYPAILCLESKVRRQCFRRECLGLWTISTTHPINSPISQLW